MQELRQTNHSDKDPDVLRYEQMEINDTEQYFDVESIENIIEFYAENEQIERAERVLNLGLKMHPDSLDLLIKKSYILIEKGEEKVAIQLLKKLLKFEETDPELYYNLAWAYLKAGNPKEAFVNFRNAINIAFDEYEVLITDIAFTLNEFDQSDYAIELLEEAILKHPKNELFLFELAYSFDKEDNTEKTIATYNRLLEINPFSELAWHNLAIIYNRIDDFQTALYCYDMALAIKPDNAEALFDKADLLIDMNEFEKAFDCYIDSISYNFDYPLGYYQLAYCLEKMNNNELALRFYDLTIKIEPAFLLPWLNYISLLINTNNAKKALEKSMEAILISDMLPEFMYLRAKAHLIANEYQKALTWFEKSVKDEPDNLRYIYEWFKVKKELFPKKDSFAILNELRPRIASRAALNYVSAAIALIEHKDFALAGSYLEFALIETPEEFQFFMDVFSFPESDILENKYLFDIISKYIDFEISDISE